MVNDKIIDLETFEVIDDSKFIIIDSLIADTISILNRLGYKTKYSCSGHCEIPKKELFMNCNLKYLQEVKQEDIEEIRNDSFDFWKEWTYTTIYILFDKKYNFKNIPKGFVLEDNCISCKINFYDEEKRKKANDIQKEINEYNKILYEWASNLPKIN